jgi:hypothetical protein
LSRSYDTTPIMQAAEDEDFQTLNAAESRAIIDALACKNTEAAASAHDKMLDAQRAAEPMIALDWSE